MRAFNDFEKMLINDMINLDVEHKINNLVNLFSQLGKKSYLPNYCFISIKSSSDVTIQVNNNKIADSGVEFLGEIEFEISKLLLTTVTLLEYLEKSGLAFFIGDSETKTLGDIDTGSIKDYTTCNFLDKENIELIYKYSRKRIFISESLITLEKNDFLSEEEIRHREEQKATKKQLLFTQIALGVTIIGLLASIFIPFMNTTSVEIKNKSIEIAINDSTATNLSNCSERISASIEKNTLGNIDSMKEINNTIEEVKSMIEIKQIYELSLINKKLEKLNLLIFDFNKKNESNKTSIAK